jgi:molybdenum cofactor cytidylyltransferase
MKLSAILLAAEESSRMGELLPLMRLAGQTLVECCATSLRQAKVHDIVVVTGHRHAEVAAEARRLGLKAAYNSDFSASMHTSVCLGMRSLAKTNGFFLLPVDFPLVRPATLSALAAAFNGKSLVVPQFAEKTGFPFLIPTQLQKAILDDDGADGLHGLLQRRKSKELKRVQVWDRGILLGAEKPEDIAALGNHLTRLTIGERSEALALAGLLLPEKGLAHGRSVAGVAEALGLELNRHGCALDIDLLYNSGLLHDVAKGRTRHEAVGAKLLRGLGLHPVAEVVAGHRDMPPPVSGTLSEKEVVFLADKLIRGKSRIAVRQRFMEKLELYAGKKAICRGIRVRMNHALSLQEMVERATGLEISAILGD